MTSLERKQPDFLIRCSHGLDGSASLAAKYRWAPGQGVWVPVSVRGKNNVTITNLRGNSAHDWWNMELAPANDPAAGSPLHAEMKDKRALREHHEICCGARHCNNKTSCDNSHLRFLFELIVHSVGRSAQPHQRDWVYLLADLAMIDERGDIGLTIDGLRAALALNKAKFVRHTE